MDWKIERVRIGSIVLIAVGARTFVPRMSDRVSAMLPEGRKLDAGRVLVHYGGRG